MISTVLQHLDQLRTELDSIDPASDLDTAGKVADIAAALRNLLVPVTRNEIERRTTANRAEQRNAA